MPAAGKLLGERGADSSASQNHVVHGKSRYRTKWCGVACFHHDQEPSHRSSSPENRRRRRALSPCRRANPAGDHSDGRRDPAQSRIWRRHSPRRSHGSDRRSRLRDARTDPEPERRPSGRGPISLVALGCCSSLIQAHLPHPHSRPRGGSRDQCAGSCGRS